MIRKAPSGRAHRWKGKYGKRREEILGTQVNGMKGCGDCNLCSRESEPVIQAAAAGESCVCNGAKGRRGTIETK